MSEGIPESGFAELLRELKNRSGHSYGTLAKRLHMSTSTLHRYCNGDAVPTDYAPVERLARLCKATPQELVELHRRWVLADAGRGRKNAEPAVVVPEPAPEREEGAQTPLETEEGAQAVPEPEAAAGREPEPEPEAAPVPVPASVPEPPSTTRWRRSRTLIAGRRTALLAAATVTALVVGGTVFALNRPSAEGERREEAKAPATTAGSAFVQDSATPRPPRSGSPTPHGSATRSASPSASASASSEAPGLATDTTDGKHTGKPSASARQEASGAVPLTVNTNPYSWVDPCSQHYLIDRPPAAVGPPPTEQQAPAWVAVNKAVSAGEQFITFTVQGTGDQTVVLERLSVHMAGKRSPLAWNDYAMGYPGVGCGGGVPTHTFSVALDAMRPAPVPQAGGADFPFKVSQSDPEVFYVEADASAYDVSWYLELTWSSGGRHGTLVINDAGHPFRTSGNNSRPAYAFPLGGQRWKPASEFQ